MNEIDGTTHISLEARAELDVIMTFTQRPEWQYAPDTATESSEAAFARWGLPGPNQPLVMLERDFAAELVVDCLDRVAHKELTASRRQVVLDNILEDEIPIIIAETEEQQRQKRKKLAAAILFDAITSDSDISDAIGS